jgi:diguanylate cyclase (GGDEF)-like protein/PAS domain S-box-containing protein
MNHRFDPLKLGGMLSLGVPPAKAPAGRAVLGVPALSLLRRSPLWAFFVSVVVVGIALSGITRLHQRADDCRRAELALARIEWAADRLSRLELEAASGGGLTPRRRAEIQAARQQMSEEAALLWRLSGPVGRLRSLLRNYETALDQALAEFDRERTQHASQVISQRLAPALRNLQVGLHRVGADQSVIAVRMNDDANNGSLWIVLISLLGIGIPGWHYYRLRESSLLAHAAGEALRASEQRFRSLVENGADVNLVLDQEGLLQYVGPAVERALDRRPADLLHRCWQEILHREDWPQAHVLLHRAERDSEPTELRLLHASGEWRYFEAVAHCRLEDPHIQGIVVNCWDVTERKRVEVALRQSEERYALAARGANDGLWDWDLETDLIYLSPRWWSMLGYPEEARSESPKAWLDRVHPRDVALLRAELQRRAGEGSATFQCEYRIRDRAGEYRWMLCRGIAVYSETGSLIRLVGSQTDVTERKSAEDQLVHAAFHDELTDLPNRTLLMELLSACIQRKAHNPDWSFAVLFLDLDRFKTVNDSLGHLMGDKLLVSVSRRLLTCVRSGDTVARLGGDEFAILLDGMEGLLEAERVADRIQRELQFPFDLDGYEIYASASIGIAGSSFGYERPDDVLRDADTAMYAAKFLGKARYAVFDEDMHARVVSQLNLENDLRRALDRDELRVEYQPIIRMHDQKLSGFEALVRWQHPERGLIPPSQYISLAEDSGLIIAIDHWVLREACLQHREWSRRSGGELLSVSVNLSTRHLSQDGLVQRIDEILAESGVPGSALRLEVTESAVIENSQEASIVLEQLRERGVQISMDDFGTGYSSLAYLHRYPFDVLKIDRSFLGTASPDKEAWDVVQTIISLARVMGLRVVAEGVETAAQVERLRRLGCDYAQGFYFSEPVGAEEAIRFLAHPEASQPELAVAARP